MKSEDFEVYHGINPMERDAFFDDKRIRYYTDNMGTYRSVYKIGRQLGLFKEMGVTDFVYALCDINGSCNCNHRPNIGDRFGFKCKNDISNLRELCRKQEADTFQLEYVTAAAYDGFLPSEYCSKDANVVNPLYGMGRLNSFPGIFALIEFAKRLF
jgi:hypothetical protein